MFTKPLNEATGQAHGENLFQGKLFSKLGDQSTTGASLKRKSTYKGFR